MLCITVHLSVQSFYLNLVSCLSVCQTFYVGQDQCLRESHQKHAKHALIVAWSHLRSRGIEERALLRSKYLQFLWTSNWIKQIANSRWTWIIAIFSLPAAAFSNSKERGTVGDINVILFMWSWRLTIRYWDRLMSLFTKTRRRYMQRCRDFSNKQRSDWLLITPPNSHCWKLLKYPSGVKFPIMGSSSRSKKQESHNCKN